MTGSRDDEWRAVERKEREVADLLRQAGPREQPPREDVEAALSAARFAWHRRVELRTVEHRKVERQETEGTVGPPVAGVEEGAAVRSIDQRFSRRRVLVGVAALAAAALVAIGIRFLDPGASSSIPSLVATLEQSVGDVEILDDGRWTSLPAGAEIPLGAEMRTGQNALASLRTTEGASLRFDRASRWSFASVSTIELAAGGAYVDTGVADGLTVATAIGAARDIGTRFAVRVDDDTMRVGVRDGAVVVERGDESFRADRGVELRVGRRGPPVRAQISAFSDAWSWTHELAPRFELEGSTLASFLEWLATETGWTVEYDAGSVGEGADEIVLHGSLEGVSPLDAPALVLPGAAVSYRLENGVLVIE